MTQQLPQGLYFVATPIGNARDITLRALDLLRDADVIAAEDTRSMRRLLEIHGVPLRDRPLLAYHDHNGGKMRPKLLDHLAKGRSVVYASEAGTPLVADPGYDLSRAVVEAGYPVTSAPGASAVVTALTLAGLPTDRFLFNGFLPNASGQRKSALSDLSTIPATLVFYESPKRLGAMLRDAEAVLGPDRPAAMCRELTKKFETCVRGSLGELAAKFSTETVKGEIVVLIGKSDSPNISLEDATLMLEQALETMSVKDAADTVSRATGLPRRQVYQQALSIGRSQE